MEEANAVQKRQKAETENLDVPQHSWQNILCTDETKMDLFGRNTQRFVCGGVKKCHSTQHQNLIHTMNYGGRVAVMD